MAQLPKFIAPQLSLLVTKPPTQPGWLHELKYDGYRMAMRIRAGKVQLLTRSGLDWTDKYPNVAAAAAKISAKEAYIDGELCAVRSDGTTSFAGMQSATSNVAAGGLVFFAFDLLHLDGIAVQTQPLKARKAALRRLLIKAPAAIRYADHFDGDGAAFHEKVCQTLAEGIMCKRADAPYAPGDRGTWLKLKCHQRAEFIIVGYTEPEGSRPHFGALLLAYYDDAGKLIYAGRVGGGFSDKKLGEMLMVLRPLKVEKMPLDISPPRKTRFGSPLILSRVHWVKPKLVCEVRFTSWTGDGLLRHTVFEGLRSDKKAKYVRRELPVER